MSKKKIKFGLNKKTIIIATSQKKPMREVFYIFLLPKAHIKQWGKI